MIVVFGSVNVDLVCRVDRIARPGETVLAPGYEQLFGGKGANQAVAAARALEVADRVVMVGAVGRDALGEAAAANLAREGVDVSCLLRVEEPTGCAFITVDAAGENAITVASGANRMLTASSLPNAEAGARDVYVMQMEVSFAETAAAAAMARRRNGRTMVNFAPVPPSLTKSEIDGLLTATDILVVNEHELRTVAEILGAAASGSLQALAAAVAAACQVTVIATLGADGALLVEADQPVRRVPALPVTAVDTTGAGDTLVGVLAAGLDAGLDLPAALERAVAAASLACRRLGAQSAMPTAREIDACRP